MGTRKISPIPYFSKRGTRIYREELPSTYRAKFHFPLWNHPPLKKGERGRFEFFRSFRGIKGGFVLCRIRHRRRPSHKRPNHDRRASVLLLACLLLLPAWLCALEVPSLRGRVNDLAGLLPGGRSQVLEERLHRFEEQTGHQIAVLTIPTLDGEDLEGFSIRVAETWKIGKKGFDNGVILLVVHNDRKLRIEVGYGLEGILPDAIASRIIREVIVPRFRANDYAGGIESGIDAIIKVTRGESLPEATKRPRGGAGISTGELLFILLLLAIPIIGVLSSLTQRRTLGPWSGGRGRHSGGWGPPFGGGGGGGSGGGFSGGGGGFGGGGASGSW
ncbi:MAG: TPM domain-containing protein [Deltaproteobacteria bacterium]|nr:TPM domain-containing protein [Deltaproteobacteria bacterium]